jgi:hypothetical protein
MDCKRDAIGQTTGSRYRQSRNELACGSISADSGELSMRWIYLLVAILGFALAYTAKSSGLLALGLIAGLGGLTAALVAIAAARIAERTRPDAALLSDADINALRRSVQKSREARTTAAALSPGASPDRD